MKPSGVPTVLVMFSGGLDSTACIWHVLENSGYKEFDIHVHHMHLINRESRWLAESIAAGNIISEFRKDYPDRYIHYTTTSIEYLDFANFVKDAFFTRFIASTIVINDPSITHVMAGRIISDSGNYRNLDYKQIVLGNAEKMFNLITETFTAHATSWVYPFEFWPKKKVYNYLPAKYRNLTWSCRNPVYIKGNPTPCENCKTCREISEFLGS